VLDVTPLAVAFWWQLAADARTAPPARSVLEDLVSSRQADRRRGAFDGDEDHQKMRLETLM
jgi:hypothetical protein